MHSSGNFASPNYPYRLAVLIGRFQPWHQGHAGLLKTALQHAPRCLLVLGSAQSAPSAQNPWSAKEREAMIRANLQLDQAKRVCFIAQDDCYNNALWADRVRAHAQTLEPEARHIALVGHHKDNSSAYLNSFPAWGWIAGTPLADTHASDIRAAFFAFILRSYSAANKALSTTCFTHPLLSPQTQAWLALWLSTPEALRLAREWQHLNEYHHSWAHSPFPVNFVTTDALVQVQDQGVEKLLLVQRKNPPGENLLALPGGFLNPDETLWQCMLRELAEETGLAIDTQVAQAALHKHAVFDHPQRSSKGRIITHAYHLHLGTDSAPKVCSTDDANSADWYPVTSVLQWRRKLHDDHAHIIAHFLKSHFLKSAPC